jgi:hypothetical protein
LMTATRTSSFAALHNSVLSIKNSFQQYVIDLSSESQVDPELKFLVEKTPSHCDLSYYE